MVAVAGFGAALVPCTCGELVQGVLEGEPFLVSCPIDSYSRVSVVLGGSVSPGRPPAPPKAARAAAATLERLGHGGTPFALEVSCPLLPSKGFGSSTADVVGAIVATASALGVSPSPGEVAGLAVGVEPSDSTMFPGLALFSHRTARRWELLGPAPPLLVAVLEFEGVVDTLDYNAHLDLARLRSMESHHARALGLLRQGLARRRPELIGRAATASALDNQELLPKPQLDRVIELGRQVGALGVCAAHSGTALGVLFAPGGERQAHGLLALAGRRLDGLSRAWVARMVDGGARVLAVGSRSLPAGEPEALGSRSRVAVTKYVER